MRKSLSLEYLKNEGSGLGEQSRRALRQVHVWCGWKMSGEGKNTGVGCHAPPPGAAQLASIRQMSGQESRG